MSNPGDQDPSSTSGTPDSSLSGATIVNLPPPDPASNPGAGNGGNNQTQTAGTGNHGHGGANTTNQGNTQPPGAQNHPNPGATTTTAQATFRPTTPKFGGVHLVGADQWLAWTGGEPLPDWTALAEPNPSVIDPKQYRPTSVTAQQKCEKHRTNGISPKFKEKGRLLQFQKKIMEHINDNGMSTVTFVQSPIDNTQVVSIIDRHSLFTLEQGIAAGKAVEPHFDNYDLSNMKNAKKFLLNSLDADLREQLEDTCDTEDNFVTYWMQLIHIVRSVSIDRFDDIKTSFKDKKITDYDGENVRLMASDYITEWKELHDATEFDPNLIGDMIKALMKAGEGNEDFKYSLRSLQDTLETQLLTTRHMAYLDRHAALVAAGVDVKSILNKAKTQYRKMLDAGEWPAAQSATDSRRLSRSFGGTVSRTELSEFRDLMANALIQAQARSSTPRDVSQDECLHCGKKGHWAKDCPEKKGKKGKKPFNSRDKSRRNNPGKATRRKRGTSNKPPPPKPGESEITHIDGDKYYWCSKCNRWTRTHGTETHRDKSSDPSAGMTARRVQFNMAPSAFTARIRPAPWTPPAAQPSAMPWIAPTWLTLLSDMMVAWLPYICFFVLPTISMSMDPSLSWLLWIPAVLLGLHHLKQSDWYKSKFP